MEDHPETRSDSLMAHHLGSSISSHYDKWENEPINTAKPRRVKVAHLLEYWKATTNHINMKKLVLDFDEKLGLDISFNSFREDVKKRFL